MTFIKSKTMFIVIVIFIISLQIQNSYSSPQQWETNAEGCNAIPQGQGNSIPGDILFVYLGQGSNVPSTILAEYPSASAGFLEDWKTQMVGLTQNKIESIKIAGANAYPPGHGSGLGGKDLFFDVTITNIHTGETITTRNSVVDVHYILYTDCQEITGTQTNSGVSSTTSNSPENNSENTLIIGISVILGVIIFGGIAGFFFSRSRSQVLNEKIIEQTSKRQDDKIQSLKKVLKDKETSTSDTKGVRGSTSRRRRR